MAHGVKKAAGSVRLQNRQHSDVPVDSGVRSTAQVEAYKPKRRPPLTFLLRRVEISRPGPESEQIKKDKLVQ